MDFLRRTGFVLNTLLMASLVFLRAEKSLGDYFAERYGEVKITDYWNVYRGFPQIGFGAYIGERPIIEGDEVGAFVDNNLIGYCVKRGGERAGDFSFYAYAPDPKAFQGATPEFRIYSIRGEREFPADITFGDGRWRNFGYRDIKLEAVIPLAGDVNYDSRVDGNDISLFVNVLLNPFSARFREFSASDMNADGNVDSLDVPLFVRALTR